MKKFKIKQKSNRSGFTLVELVITIAVVIILSVVSIPIYRSYTTKAKFSEGYALIGLIISAQKSYYSEHGNFLLAGNSSAAPAEKTCYEKVLGIDARGNKYFTYFYINGSLGVKREKFYVDAGAVIPPDLVSENGGGSNLLVLQYNITKGGKIVHYPNLDATWYNN